MDESLEKWERWLEQSLQMDTGYPKIRVRASFALRQDVNVQRSGDVFEVDVYAPIRHQPERFKDAYGYALRFVIQNLAE